MRHLKSIILFILFFTSIILNTFSQKKIHIGEAVNIAGKQRMLGQRMAKNKLYIEANTNSKNAKKELEKTITAFELGLKNLYEFAPNKEVKYQIELQKFAFKQYKGLIEKTTENSTKEVIDCNTLFLEICDEGVTSIINYSKTYKDSNIDKNQKYVVENIAKATGASGKLRYLTQRLTLYYAMNAFKIKKVTPKEINKIVSTMESNLNYLTVLEFNTLEIDDSLSQVLYYWSKLKSAIYKRGKVNMNSEKIDPEELYDLCNTILSKANATTKMYADLNKS